MVRGTRLSGIFNGFAADSKIESRVERERDGYRINNRQSLELMPMGKSGITRSDCNFLHHA